MGAGGAGKADGDGRRTGGVVDGGVRERMAVPAASTAEADAGQILRSRACCSCGANAPRRLLVANLGDSRGAGSASGGAAPSATTTSPTVRTSAPVCRCRTACAYSCHVEDGTRGAARRLAALPRRWRSPSPAPPSRCARPERSPPSPCFPSWPERRLPPSAARAQPLPPLMSLTTTKRMTIDTL